FRLASSRSRGPRRHTGRPFTCWCVQAFDSGGVASISRGLSASDTPGTVRADYSTPAGVAAIRHSRRPSHHNAVWERRTQMSFVELDLRRTSMREWEAMLRPLPGSESDADSHQGCRWRSTPG